jgi:hypothetical protein
MGVQGGSSGISNARSATGSTALNQRGASLLASNFSDGFPGASSSAALGAGGMKAFDLLPNRDKIPEALKNQTGMSMGDIAAALEGGASPSQILGKMDGMPGDFAEHVKDYEKMAQAGELSMTSTNLATASAIMKGAGGGGGQTSAQKTSLFGSLFGSKGGLSAGPTDTAFEKKKQVLEEAREGDIFHEEWQGSIFQIVSNKLVKTRDRVENSEWVTPLNRALNGLSNKGK